MSSFKFFLSFVLILSPLAFAQAKPNIVLIYADDMGIDSVRAFNEKLGLETLTPNSFSIVVFKEVLETLAKFGYIMLLLFKSILLKIIPVFTGAGSIFIFTFKPV